MIRVRFSHPERKPEWIMGAATLCWGLNAFVDSFLHVARHTMDSPFFAPLLDTGIDQRGWGVFAVLVGAVRLGFLVVNGSRPRGSTVLRAIGAGCSAVFWASLVLGSLSLPWNSGAVAIYGALLAFDLSSVWQAAREIAPAYSRARMAHGKH